jgi:hypothetical protein
MLLSRRKILTTCVFWVVLLALMIPVILAEQRILDHTQGNLTLPRDESFVNISVGKNLAFYGVWGLSKYAFQPAASSLLYPIILVPFFFIAGANLLIPLLINMVAAIFLLKIVQRSLVKKDQPLLIQMAVLLLLVYLTALPLLVISGMEYTVFLLFTALFAAAVSNGPIRISTYVYAFLLVAIRYEGLLIVIGFCGVLLYRRQYGHSLQLLATAILPILLFGMLSTSKGGAFIPQSLLLPSAGEIYIAAIIGTVLIILTLTIPPSFKPLWGLISLLIIIGIIGTLTFMENTTRTAVTTYHQQVQAARFVHRYYYHAGISLNETGAVSYFSEGRKVDLTGIASYTDSISRRQGARVAILSGPQSGSKPAGRWGKVASWKDPNDFVSFYALDTAYGRLLRQNLQEFETSLPAEIQVRYY